MGLSTAQDLAEYAPDLETAIRAHFASNCYPPIPAVMVAPAIKALERYREGDYDARVELPEGITFSGHHHAPASAIVDQHHLDAFV